VKASKPDPLADLKVEIIASLGETSMRAECPLSASVAVAARLHQALEALVKLKPSAAPFAEPQSHALLYVPDEGDPEQGRKRLGFGRA
jgi:hypothetical protein